MNMLEVISFYLPNDLVTVLIVIVLCLFLASEYQRIQGLPPGPYGLPYIGYVFSIDSDRVGQQFSKLGRKYNSDIISISVFGSPLVVLNSFEIIKEVFQKRADVAGRLDASAFQFADPDFRGIISTSGQQWKEIRRFSISTLRDFGMGRVGAEEMIQEEAAVLCDAIKEQKEAFNPQPCINIAVSNIICGMVFGQRFQHNDEEFIVALEAMNRVLLRFNNAALFFGMRYKLLRETILKHVHLKVIEDYNDIQQFVTKRIQEHKEVYNGQTTDLIYRYLKEMDEGRNPDVFDDKMLNSLIIDFFFAGSETSYTTLQWCLLAMATFPDVQTKVQEELDHVIGDRAPSMGDKKHTPYSEAALCEIQRYFTLVPVGVFHANLDGEVEINGYRIPQNASFLANLSKLHHDRHYWKKPDEFNPENFLEDGKVVNLDRLVPFGIGRRACAGEALARMEVYLFFISLVKNFRVKLETDSTKPDLMGIQTGVYRPKPFKVRMEARY